MKNILRIESLGFPWKTQDPFLFCVYHRDNFPNGNGKLGPADHHKSGRSIGGDFSGKDGWSMYHGSSMPGFPYHPHSGFETITINKEGVVDHSDSLGAAGRFMAGDVQWMTAGKGVQHSEMFPLVHEDKGNPLEIFQIWLNLPRASKKVDAHFKMLWREEIPLIEHKDALGKKTIIDVIAGSIGEVEALDATPDSWAANPENAVGVFTVKMEAGAEWVLPKTSSDAHRTIFFYKGENMTIAGQEIAVQKRIEAVSDEEISLKNGSRESYLLILEGKPINEPVVQHGPYVANTQDEIRETMREYGRTQFGGWPWNQREVAHGGPEQGRFALHADGRREER